MNHTVTVKKLGKEIEITATLPVQCGEVLFEIESERNKAVSRLSGISPLDPQREEKEAKPRADAEMWFPVVDIVIEPGMKARAVFSGDFRGSCKVNGAFWPKDIEFDRKLEIPAEMLLDWENAIFVRSCAVSLEKFSICKKCPVVPTISRRVTGTVRLLSDDWNGRVTVYYEYNGNFEVLGSVEVKTEACREASANAPIRGRTAASTGDVEESLRMTLGYLLASVNHSVNSPVRDGLYLFYDLDAGTYRNSNWLWGWGPALKLLLDASKIPEAASRYGSDTLVEAARKAGKTSLKFQIHNPWHVTDGLGTIRWSPKTFANSGFQELVNSGSDAGFLAGWGWLPIYEETGDIAFLTAARKFGDATERLVNMFELLPQEYLPETGEWTDFTIDESGFGTEGIAALYKATGDERYSRLCRQYMEQHLRKFARKDGMWDRHWNNRTKTVTPTDHMTRGLGWAMEGLLATHRAAPEGGRYLEMAVRMAEHLLQWQQPAGCWNFIFTEPAEKVGIGEKATALWSLLFYMLYKETGDKRHLEAGRKALAWCMENQYRGPDLHAAGGIVGCSPHSGVSYRPWFRLTCAYTSGFFGLAALEEIKL